MAMVKVSCETILDIELVVEHKKNVFIFVAGIVRFFCREKMKKSAHLPAQIKF